MTRHWNAGRPVVYTRRRWLHDFGSIFVLLFWALVICIAVTYIIRYWFIAVSVMVALLAFVVYGLRILRSRRKAADYDRYMDRYEHAGPDAPLTGPEDFWDGR